MGGLRISLFFNLIENEMAAPTTVDTDTELSAVNSILGAIGQAPVSSLDYDSATDSGAFENPEISFIYNLLKESNIDIQNEGWSFNREDHIVKTPDTDGYISIPSNVLRMDITDGQIGSTGLNNKFRDVVKRNGRLYDKVNHTDVFTGDITVNVVWLWEYEDLPSVFKRYITYKASGRAATQLVANQELVKLIGAQELQARAACMEYECNQGDHSFFGLPHESSYNSYQPYLALRR